MAYDGTEFSGWARQDRRRTVEGELVRALATALRHDVDVVVAGRTDAGVHARGQVVHVDVPRTALDAQAGGGPGRGRPPAPVDRLVRRLRGLLPPDVAVTDAGMAPPGFDARFSALRRRYAYRVSDAPGGPDPLRRHDTVRWPRALDVDRLGAASAPLLGRHDFLAFCRPRVGATTVRTLERLRWTRQDAVDGRPGDVVVALVDADAFCHSMVRSLVGALLLVGDGRREVSWPAALLAAAVAHGRARAAAPVAPAHGLVLRGVDYADDLVARARLTRARRGPAPPTGPPAAVDVP